jgi:hypothetical protein
LHVEAGWVAFQGGLRCLSRSPSPPARPRRRRRAAPRLDAGLHDTAAVRVSAALADGVLRIEVEVEDGGTSGAVVRREPNRDRGGGFGLNIIDALALCWGVERADGTVVWVELGC